MLVFRKVNPKALDLAGTETPSAVLDLFVPPLNHSDFKIFLKEKAKLKPENGVGRFKPR
ncbi:hypothetical protein COLO4_32109 [Corchorus olitorius]|uniref:Uncharacterized protein n=1 Tax=Corchorus olitorius TaxID=93759 RepID=A0A1R3H1J6_9ROSI|nr:hypothetical protein COLO4_32109 [Corchorus olitorius]